MFEKGSLPVEYREERADVQLESSEDDRFYSLPRFSEKGWSAIRCESVLAR